MATLTMASMASADTRLGRFLVGLPGPPPSLDAVQHATLSGAVLARLPEHPDHKTLRHNALRTAARHLAVKAALRGLIEAWNEADIAPLMLKGFYLAEFVYPSASQRVYADVDLYIEPERVANACDVAARLGWTVVWRDGEPDSLWSARRSGYHGHEAAKIRHASLDIDLDIHRRLAHNSKDRVPRYEVQARLTAAAVAKATHVTWEGVRVRLPQPVDAVVFGMALNRCWGADTWRIKPRDYCDLQALHAKYGLERSAIVERARELGVGRTIAIYLSRCDPYRGRLMLLQRGWKARWWNLRVLSERGPHDAIRDTMALVEAFEGGITLVRALPFARRAIRHVRQRVPLAAWVDHHQVTAARQRAVSSRAWANLRRAIHRHNRLGRVVDSERPAVAALVAFACLRHHGYPVELRAEDGDVLSAGLYLDGKRLLPHRPGSVDD